MKRQQFVSVLFLAGASLLLNACDRDDEKSKQSGIGSETPREKGSPGSSETSKTGVAGRGIAQANKDTSVGGSQSGRSGSGADTGTGARSGSAQTSKDTSAGGSQRNVR